MASRRRQAEDKNTKLLREIATIPANKQCFDCLQRGPTYINVTIGSFVCTTCSGIVRGLTPPHRVKSISMTTFTPEEIEYLRGRGNEYCKYVWLGTFDTSTNSIQSEVSDDQRKRDFMVQKYEKKRWYVDPDIAVKKMQSDSAFKQKQSFTQTQTYASRSNSVETQPLSRLLGKSPMPLVVQNNQPAETWPHPVSSASAPSISTKTTAQNHGSQSFDLLSEFAGNVSTAITPANNSTANGNFANFETAFSTVEKSGWTSFDDDLDPLSPSSSHSATLNKDSMPRVSSCSTVMPRPLSLPTFAPTNPFKLTPTANTSTSSQWPSFTAAAPVPNMPTSASLDAYPLQSRSAHPPNSASVFNPLPPPPVSKAAPTPAVQMSNADRYAALADLDSLFNQSSTAKAPSWTVDNPSVSSSIHDPVVNEKNSTYSSAPSNPFASTDIWNQSQPMKSSFQSANPFQPVGATASDALGYSQAAGAAPFAPFQIPMVGNSPSEDSVRNQFNSNYSPFASQLMSPTNGYAPNSQIGMPTTMLQNGGLTSSSSGSSGTWGVSSSMPMWNSSQMVVSGLFPVDNKPPEPAQHADWIQNPVNPFTVSSSSGRFPVAPKSNCSNPFL